MPPEGLFECPDAVRCIPTLHRGLEFLLASTYQREVDFLKQINLL